MSGGPTQSFQRIPTEDSGAVPVIDTDYNRRMSLNTVFGEKITAIRKADIANQFQYGFPAANASIDIANGGTVTTVESMLTVSTGTNTAGSANIANKKALRYFPGQEAFANFTAVFTSPKPNSYQRAGLFDSENGFFVGYEGTNFKVTRRRDAVDTSVTIDLKSVFDTEDGIFDPTLGNVYRISFGYLGFATISFEILSPGGFWKLLHKIEYPNSSTGTHILNTNLQPRIAVANDGNDTNIQLKTGCYSAGIIDGGGVDPSARRFTFGESAQTITAVLDTVVTFRNKTTFSTLTNYIASIFTLLSFNSDMSRSSNWELEKNATIVGTPTWNDINTDDSTIEYSTDAVVTKGTGILEFSLPLGKVDRELITNMEEQEIELLPSDYITLFITSPIGTTGTFDYSFRWKELF